MLNVIVRMSKSLLGRMALCVVGYGAIVWLAWLSTGWILR